MTGILCLLQVRRSEHQPGLGDWSGDVNCGLCGNQTKACLCHTITMVVFQLTISRMGDMALVERLADQVVLEIVQDKITSHVQETCKQGVL